VRKGLSRFGKDRRKFVSHITLARKAQKRIHGLIDPIHWQVHHIELIRSTLLSDGAKYESIARSG
jgi:2'-5' RNA ligase